MLQTFCQRKAGVFHNNNFFIHGIRGDILTGLQLAFKVSVIPLNQVNKKLKNVHPVAIRNPGSSFRTRTHHFYFSGFRIKNGEKMFRITFLFLFFAFIEGNLTIVFLSLSTFASLRRSYSKIIALSHELSIKTSTSTSTLIAADSEATVSDLFRHRA